MRIITLNINGIRAGARKGFFEWFAKQEADVLCLQEIKAQAIQLDEDIFKPAGYQRYLACAEKKGYSGVALYVKKTPQQVVNHLDWPVSDQEGRYVHAEYPGLIVASVYLPSGTTGDVRQAIKYQYLDRFDEHLKALRATGKKLILCGDWNIAHKAIDLKNWKANQKHSGFLPEERAWMDRLFGAHGFIDAFRTVNQEEEQYTWWSSRGQAWANNVGWRIDYQVVSPDVQAKTVAIYKEERFSDHAPLIIDYSTDLCLDQFGDT